MSNVPFLQSLFSLEGRLGLVTGASGGIGAELAIGLAMAGATVALNGRSTEKLARVQEKIASAEGQAACFPADLGSLDEISSLVDAVLARFGHIDVLINCAGINQREPIDAVLPEAYARIMDVNLRAAYFLSQAVARAMRRQGGGKIVNIGSINCGYGLGTVSVYGLAKGAMAQMTRVMAVEWARDNIQVNCLGPGFIETELTLPLWQDEEKRGWILDRVPLKRPGRPSDLVGLAVYLASPASDFMTGQTVYVDGGFLAGGQW